ncbi:MAG: hypothetical protein KDC07_06165 [Chitinophagaceae bacterium]|nr:hypothetical protein [Chitinophagaceae bacterium]MCB9045855.1 hypothetical protein [Chitinophagales bacterium]
MAKINVIDNLASSLGRRDEDPNIELAQKIAAAKDAAAVKDLIALLNDKKKDIHNDAIKVLYEVGYISPYLVKDHLGAFLSKLNSKNNRMIWGAMTAIDAISQVAPDKIYAHLPEILDAGEKGSVITKDHVMGTLCNLAANGKMADKVMPLLFEQLMQAAGNQFPMYAEKAMPVVTNKYKQQFIAILNDRIEGLEKDSQKKRIEKLLKKLNK